MRIVQSKFAKANLNKFRKRGGAVIDPPLSCQAAETLNKCQVTWGLRVTFLEIVIFDVVNARILIILFSLTYIFTFKKFLLYISLRNNFVSFVFRLLRSQEFVQRKQK